MLKESWQYFCSYGLHKLTIILRGKFKTEKKVIMQKYFGKTESHKEYCISEMNHIQIKQVLTNCKEPTAHITLPFL